MFERILYDLAALATIGAFLIEAWRTWKEHRRNRQRADDLEEEDSGR